MEEEIWRVKTQNRTPLVTPCTRVPVLLTFPCSFSVQVVSVSADFEIKFETPSSWIILGKSVMKIIMLLVRSVAVRRYRSSASVQGIWNGEVAEPSSTSNRALVVTHGVRNEHLNDS